MSEHAAILRQLRSAPETLGPFALLLRDQTDGRRLELLLGERELCSTLASIPLPALQHNGPLTLAMLPYRQLSERGFACIDDGEPLWALRVHTAIQLDLAQDLNVWPRASTHCVDAGFVIDDAAYMAQVSHLQYAAIGQGAGSSFVLSRRYQAQLHGYRLQQALAAFRRLVLSERQACWTFLIYDGERCWLGASPERHLSWQQGLAEMYPISGTWRFPTTGVDVAGLLQFLSDPKERDELFMVVDEELKMMARICPAGVRVNGPYLRLMSKLAHTEYSLQGQSDLDPRQMLAHSLFSPAVIGSPIENACRVIASYEDSGRGYYAGVVALFGHDPAHAWMDSAIIIRTAEISAQGALSLSVGASIVRDSDPSAEARECHAKAAAVLAAFQASVLDYDWRDAHIDRALQQRNQGMAQCWLAASDTVGMVSPRLQGQSLLIVDAEDGFTQMLAIQSRGLGLAVTVLPAAQALNVIKDYAYVLLGPGPGDPLDHADPRLQALRWVLRSTLQLRRPLLAICLSHQLLCLELGLPIHQLSAPQQGCRAKIDYFGRSESVGFYNTFVAVTAADQLHFDGDTVAICRDSLSGQVHATRSSYWVSMQFHPESIFTEHGPELLSEALLYLAELSATRYSVAGSGAV